MAILTGLTFGQKTWTPHFIQNINSATCIGCGRCFKVCGQNVLPETLNLLTKLYILGHKVA